MKIKLTKEVKVILLKALQNGYITDNDIDKLDALYKDINNNFDESKFLSTLTDDELEQYSILIEKMEDFVDGKN